MVPHDLHCLALALPCAPGVAWWAGRHTGCECVYVGVGMGLACVSRAVSVAVRGAVLVVTAVFGWFLGRAETAAKWCGA